MIKRIQKDLTVLRLPEVLIRTKLSRSQIYLLISKGKFPTTVKLGGLRATGWISEEIDRWLAEQIANRDSKLKLNKER